MSTWIFLRGLTRESRHWGDFPDTFRAEIPDADIVTLDLPGNGRLNSMRSPLDVAGMVTHCRAELTARGIRPPYRVLAMSLGAMVTVAWADRHPEEFDRCVLINTSLKPFSPFYRRLRPKNYSVLLRLAVFGGSVDVWERTILNLTSRQTSDRAQAVTEWSEVRRQNPVSRLNAARQLWAASHYRAPTSRPAVRMLVLGSAGDDLVDPSCSKGLAHRWQTDYAEHPSAGHDIPLDDGAWVARQVRDWLPSAP